MNNKLISLNCDFFRSVDSKKCVECPLGWTIFSGHCYFVSDIKLSWQNALTFCKSIGSSLIKIDNQAEYDLLYDFYLK